MKDILMDANNIGTVILYALAFDVGLWLIVLMYKRPLTAELVVSSLIGCLLLGPIGFIIVMCTWKPEPAPVKKPAPTSSLAKANAFYGSRPKLPTNASPKGMPFPQALAIAIVVAAVFVFGLYQVTYYLASNGEVMASAPTGTYEEIQKLKDEGLKRAAHYNAKPNCGDPNILQTLEELDRQQARNEYAQMNDMQLSATFIQGAFAATGQQIDPFNSNTDSVRGVLAQKFKNAEKMKDPGELRKLYVYQQPVSTTVTYNYSIQMTDDGRPYVTLLPHKQNNVQ
jgi:hypothetical protein